MTRAFDPHRPVPSDVLDRLVDAAARAPSAGKTQGWHLVLLEGPDTGRFWDRTLPEPERAGFAWPGLIDAPLIALALVDPAAYVTRYAEADKAAAGLGGGTADWPVPYWTVDGAFAVMSLLLAAEAEGLGALFFAVFNGEREVRAALDVPERLELLGAIALGWPAREPARPGASAARRRRPPAEIVHRGRW